MTFAADRILVHPPVVRPYAYTKRDTILHALAIGIGVHCTDPREVAFTYDDGLRAFPTLATVLGWVDMVRDPESRDGSLGIDEHRMVVAAIEMRIVRPLAVEGRGTTRSVFAELVDKGPGRAGLVRVRKETRDDAGETLATLDTWLHVKGGGGFGGTASGGPVAEAIPDRAPDATHTFATPTNLALLYRLSLGDHNPLHADPAYLRRQGLDRPLLHGLATFAIAVHGAVRECAGYAAERVRLARARATAPVYPGDTLQTALWRDGPAILFRTTAVERASIVLDAGRVLLD